MDIAGVDLVSLIAAVAGAVGGPRVALSNASTTDTTATPFNPNAFYTLDNVGNVSNSAGPLGLWVTPASAAGSNYEARVTVTAGSLTSGTVGSWVSLGTSRAWGLSTVSVGTVTATATVEIRSAASLNVLASATVSFSATKTL